MTDKPTGTRAPRSPNKTPEELDAEIARVRDREERKLIATAEAAGYFDIRLTKDQLEGMFRAAIETLNPKSSALAKLRDRKVHAAEKKRKDDARRKVLLGGFIVAQCRHKREFHASVASDIRAFLKEHPSETVAARNAQLLEAFLADPASHGAEPSQNDENSPAMQKHRRERAHRLILLGAWVIERHKTRADLSQLIANELEPFLDQGKDAEHHKLLIRDVLS